MQYRPNAGELLDAIAELLGGEVLADVSGHLTHRVRVAENLARILQREVRLGPSADDRERAMLASLLGEDGDLDRLRRVLAERLRRDDDPQFDEAAWEVLVAVTRQDLAIAKPGYDAWEGP